MFRKSSCFVLLAAAATLVGVSCVSADVPLIPETAAEQHGLERPWFAQVNIDHGHSRLIDMKLYEGVLYAISDTAMVQAIDAETGATLWSKRIGDPDHPSLPLGVGGDLLAVVNGSRLYVANRYNGAIMYEHTVDGAPGGGPAVNDCRVYVPTTTGMIIAYRIKLISEVNATRLERKDQMSPEELKALEEERRQKIRADVRPAVPLNYRSKGRTLAQPLVMRQSKLDEYTAWPTDEGYLYVARVDRHADNFIQIVSRIKAHGPITVHPAYLPPNEKINPDFGVLVFGSDDGFVTAIREDGVVLWQFATGEPIVQPPVSIGERIYISSRHGGLYCVDAMPDAANRAVRHWYAPGALQFVAATKKHIYAADKTGNTLVLDAATGERVDMLETSKLTLKLINDQTDRLYLATPEGLVQCLREIGAKDPARYDLERKPPEEAAKPAEKKAKGGDETPFEKKAEGGAPAKAPKKAEPKAGDEPAADEKPAVEDKPATEKKSEKKKPAEEKQPAPEAGGEASPFDP